VNGRDALDKLKDGVRPDLIVLDLMMPEMDGFAVLEELNEENIPVFVFSNLRQESDRKRAKKLGAEDFLVKSDVQVSEVIDRVNEFIGS
jgi:CheY-like chemotaxis protein